MSQHFMNREWQIGLRYLFPLLAFVFGVFVAENVQNRFKYAKKMHWRQGILLAEIGILAIVGFIPNAYNMIATVMVSFACAMQVQTFRKVGGYSYASTMCIGNLRSGTAALSLYLRDKKLNICGRPFIILELSFSLPLVRALVVFYLSVMGFMLSGYLAYCCLSVSC